MKFIKLTSAGGRIVYVRVERILGIGVRKNNGAVILLNDGYESYDVKESPEDILALIKAEVING